MRIILRRPEFYILLFILLAFSSTAHADRWGLDIFGLSYHFDPVDSQGRRLNGINPGLGLHYDLRETHRSLLAFDSGLYYSSGRSLAGFGSVAWQRKWGRFQLGPAASIFKSAFYNHGHVFVAPLLLISFHVSPITFHVLPIPRYKNKNRNAAIGFFTTWNF